jgi:hypothetical protein
MKKEIEFNNGFVTALALFYGHYSQEPPKYESEYGVRIYPASDHLIDIEYPKNLDPELRRKVEKFVKDVLSVRLKDISRAEEERLFIRCLELLKLIDKKHFKLKVKVKSR